MRTLLLIVFVSTAIAALPGTSIGAKQKQSLQIKWTKDPGVRIESGSVPYAQRLTSGAEKGKTRLYYCNMDSIFSAISSNGLNFTQEPGTRLSPSNEFEGSEFAVCDPTAVSLADGRTRLYYKAALGQGGPGSAIHKVFSAVTSDGLNFTKEGMRIDSEKTGDRGWASVPEATLLPDGRVRIYYVSGDFTAHGGIMSAISSDGLSFTKERGARATELVDPAIVKVRKGLYLFAGVVLKFKGPPIAGQSRTGIQSSTGIYTLTSTDGLKFKNKRLILKDSNAFDPSIVKIDRNRYRIYYGKNVGSEGMPKMQTWSMTGKVKTSR